MPPPPRRAYIICTSPRSGSTLLCSLLAATGAAGNPASYFHRPSLADWAKGVDLTVANGMSEAVALSAVFAAVRAKGTRGGIFGLRLQRHSFAYFMEKLAAHAPGATDLEQIEAAFGPTLFIHLTRADKLAQAVSYIRAEQSGLWHRAPDGSELERLSGPQPLRYDPTAIGAQMREMEAMDDAWRAWFAKIGVAPMRIAYDALSADPGGAVREILTGLGVDPKAAEGVRPGVAKLADEVSAAWIRRFRAEEGG